MFERMIPRKGRPLAPLALALFFLMPLQAQTTQAQTDTVQVTLQAVLERALDVSPDLGEIRADVDFAAARSRLARSSRYLTEFNLTTAHAIAPGIDNPNGTPENALYLDPDVRNDFSNWSPFTQAEVELIQPLYTWGELGGNIRAAQHGVEVEEAAVERGSVRDAAGRSVGERQFEPQPRMLGRRLYPWRPQ